MINTPYTDLEKGYKPLHPGFQFLIFIGLLVAILFVGNLIGAGLVIGMYGFKTLIAISTLTVTAPNFVNALWILQIAGTTTPIIATAVFFAYVIVRQPENYLKSSFHFNWVLIVLVFAIMLISNPIIEYLSDLNQKMVLPHWLQWMREKEDEAQKLTEVLLRMKTIWNMLFDLLLIGLITAIVEEFLFRGVLQTIFLRWTKNTHAAVWITAILFSAFHMEFFGFLPRLMLGALFGYFVAWSGSIWPGVWAHFINNGTAVVATWLFQRKVIKVNPDGQHLFSYTAYIISLLIVLFLLFVYRKAAVKKEPEPGLSI